MLKFACGVLSATLLTTTVHARPCGQGARIVIHAHHKDTRVLAYASRELRAYATRLFGRDWAKSNAPGADLIILESAQESDTTPGLDAEDSYELSATRSGLIIHGRNDRSVLYGVYELIRSWGARFYLSGDVLPENPTCSLPDERISRAATLRLRGVHPYPDFLAGPSSWDLRQFSSYIRQLPKLGLNFFSLHQYTYEPYLDYSVDGVHPRSGHLETSATPEWGYGNVPTCRFEIGRELFRSCVWGSSTALNSRTPAERYSGGEALLSAAFEIAHDAGLITGFGFEPMSNDPEFAELAKTPEGARAVLEARIEAVLRALPRLDYLWLFADESHQADEATLRATYALIASGEKSLKSHAPDKHLMIGGWNVEHTLRDYDVVKDGVAFGNDTVFTSYGNYDPWRTVSENRESLFKNLRHGHSIAAWCEYDGRLLAGPQPNVTAYERMVPLMRGSSSLGFFFLHWNTRLCDANLEYLSQAAWSEDVSGAADFYARYFETRFGVSPGPTQALLALEAINKSFAYGHSAFWLLADDWTPEGPWRRLAETVERFRSGRGLSQEDAAYFHGQLEQARELAKQFAELDMIDSAMRALKADCRRDCRQATFFADRYLYFTAFLREHVKLSLAIEGFLGGRLDSLRTGLDLAAWRNIVALYARHTDDRGEKGIVVSLNQKVLAGLRRLETALKPR